MKAYVTMVSKLPVQSKPKIFSIGGFAAISKDGRPYVFNFKGLIVSVEFDVSGRLIFDIELNVLDEKFITDSLGHERSNVVFSGLTPEYIASSTLAEVFYECFAENELKGPLIPLEIKEFELEDNINGEEISAAFTAEELQRYDREDAVYLRIPQKTKKQILALAQSFQEVGSGEATHVGEWLKILLEGLTDDQDIPSLISSLDEIKSSTDALISELREIGNLSCAASSLRPMEYAAAICQVGMSTKGKGK